MHFVCLSITVGILLAYVVPDEAAIQEYESSGLRSGIQLRRIKSWSSSDFTKDYILEDTKRNNSASLTYCKSLVLSDPVGLANFTVTEEVGGIPATVKATSITAWTDGVEKQELSNFVWHEGSTAGTDEKIMEKDLEAPLEKLKGYSNVDYSPIWCVLFDSKSKDANDKPALHIDKCSLEHATLCNTRKFT